MSTRFVQARDRMTRVVEGWFISEPLLFAAWTEHQIIAQPNIETIRVGRGQVEYNPEFIQSLSRSQLKQVLEFEVMRILLGHPYLRRQPSAEWSLTASNLAVQECLRSDLPLPRARELFDDASFDNQYFEFYYRELSERATSEDESRDPPEDPAGDQDDSSGLAGSQPDDDQPGDGDQDSTNDETGAGQSGPAPAAGVGDDAAGEQRQAAPNSLSSYVNAHQVADENTADWDADDLFKDAVDSAIREAAESDGWGTLGGTAKDKLLATLKPKVDYRRVLSHFRQSVLSVRRRLTRMKPSRRYGFNQMGSRYDFTTKLLFAVDVSGSMSSQDLVLGFSVVSRFFRYGIESIDVLWFDTEIQGEPLTLRRARHEFHVTGRGGTSFQPLIDYIDAHRTYDGLIIYTDGYAPAPRRPKNLNTRILWLLKDEATHTKLTPQLRSLGKTAFLKPSAGLPTSPLRG
ncbi:MAG: VWA-like domain-containing protein [Planctomycetota bacterium]